MNTRSLLVQINNYLSNKISDNADKIILGIIMYNYIKDLYAVDNSINIRETIDSYYSVLKNNFENYKTEYVGYSTMRNLVKDNLLSYSEGDMLEIINLYKNRTRAVLFGEGFHPGMYKVAEIGGTELTYLAQIHREIMLSISRYYNENYGKKLSSINIINAELSKTLPGRDILFEIEGIDAANIVADINSNTIKIPFWSCRVQDNYVRLINI